MSGSASESVIAKPLPNPNRAPAYLLLVKCLALLMMGVGSWVIFNRLHHWRLYTSEDMNNFASDTTMINLRLMVTLVLGSSGLVPIILGIGLWYRRCWARTLSLCLFAALLLPALATVAKLTTSPLVQERPLLNPIIIVVSFLGLGILLWPSLILAIRARQSKRG
ncbi:MAG: hypothetical protein WCO45_09370 [Pseudanabaena sp. ELA607]